jgi:EAL domain-containing protein (putative c-di-GMP-specific phosphodiesterase class I)
MFGRTLGRRRERYGILIYNLLIFAALIIRLTLPKYLIMDTLILIAILIVFLAFGNPDFHLDLRGTAFNRPALSKYLEENTGRLKLTPFGVVIRNYHEMRDLYESSQMEEGLVMIAKYLKRISPKGILFYCRKGRFIVLDQPGRNFRKEAKTITERFDHPWKSHSTELYLSAGCATFDNITGNYSSEILLSTMLKALESIGRAETEEPLTVTEEDIKRTETERGVRQCIENALENDGFELYLQPIVDAKTGRIIGAEALSRIRDTEGNIIPPGLFITVAENSGRINRLGELVFDRTCKFIKENPIEKMGIEWINVNLSPLQFLCTDLDERFLSIINKYGIDPNSVHLEITEESMIDDRFLQKQIKAMGEKGFLFVLDDYGTGYSNLSRLKKCPFINVKLDMSIVWDYCREPDDILPNMILAFKNMGFSITAEGIEDENMINTMKSIGCDLLQGYYYSKPVPASDFPKII